MPLSEDEQRILSEIEDNLTATDPALAQQVSETTLYRHAVRMIRWAALGFLAGLVLLVITLRNPFVAVIGFLIMLACSLVIERNARKLGRAGLQSLTSSVRGGSFKKLFGDGAKWRDRWRRGDDQP
ncbi:MAG TPA: DUF3040 domain-containing protein [Acidimicrobiia bacterium]|nr:DUF3040 domain-containing protein [Acidimicrobiia bacterium]